MLVLESQAASDVDISLFGQRNRLRSDDCSCMIDHHMLFQCHRAGEVVIRPAQVIGIQPLRKGTAMNPFFHIQCFLA